jgi:hypothetical protein
MEGKMLRLVMIYVGTVIALHADTLAVPAVDEASPGPSFFPGFTQSFFFQAPAFDTTLGHLNSVTADWQTFVSAVEHTYIAQIGTPFTLTFSQTMVVTIDGKDSTPDIQSDSFVETVTTYSLEAEVGLPFDISGQTTIPIADYFTDSDSEFLFFSGAISLSGETLPNADGSESGAFLTDNFQTIDQQTLAGLVADISYDYTPVPEPRGYAVLLVLVLVACIAARFRASA